MKPFREAAVQSKMEYRQGSAACQMPELQTLDGSATTSRSPVTFRGTDNFGNMLINLPKRDLVTFEGDPARHWLFMRCFEVNVLKSTTDPTIRSPKHLAKAVRKATHDSQDAHRCPHGWPRDQTRRFRNPIGTSWGASHLLHHLKAIKV
ncbi:unnamed protein product [Echinostoma caproni]|uniref:Uncharacterized protein n=1 Tax=Echinostoma caproni TaxID=27848 RepID=A0A183AZ05_9TREM|nr:unnamed protein product [Echinostoma caproni]